VRQRKCECHGLHKNAVLRSWREGYRLRYIAGRYGLSRVEVARIIVAAGVCWSHVAIRERE